MKTNKTIRRVDPFSDQLGNVIGEILSGGAKGLENCKIPETRYKGLQDHELQANVWPILNGGGSLDELITEALQRVQKDPTKMWVAKNVAGHIPDEDRKLYILDRLTEIESSSKPGTSPKNPSSPTADHNKDVNMKI